MSSQISKPSIKHLKRSGELLKKYRTGILAGTTLSLLAVFLMQQSDERETVHVFKQEGALDFKNASVLGNPGRVLIKEEESRLSRTQRSVLESQTLLKSEVESLRAELLQLKNPGQPVPMPSGSPSESLLNAASGVQKDSRSPEAYGPTLPPRENGEKSSVQPGDEFNHTRIDQAPSDQIQTHAAAAEFNSERTRPNRNRPNSLGLDTPALTREKTSGLSIISFPVKSNGKAFLKKPGIILPSGSYVKAVLMTGIEAPEGKTYPVLIQLDYAYVIPNDKRLDLSGCFMIAKAQGDLSTERVQMQATKLSCVSRKGGMFEREVNGFIADNADNSFAVMGRVNTKQDRVAATAFLSSIVSGIGKAIQQAQATQQATPLGGAQSVVTGDQAKFIGAGGASEAATMVTQWYLKQAQSLLPTINVGSGQQVWIVMQDQVDLPKDYFTQNNIGGISNATIYSYFTKLMD